MRGRLDAQQLETAIAEGRVETVVTAFPDLYGRLVGKRIHAPFYLEEVVADGVHACDYLLACDMEMDPTPGYRFTSWEQGYGDFHMRPDPGTLRSAAWLERSAIVLCDLLDEQTGEPVEVAPRQVLKRQIARLAERGLAPMMGSELEFYLFRESYADARRKQFRGLATAVDYIEDYHVLSGGYVEDVIGAIRRGVHDSAIPVEFSKGEWAPGQHEINLRYAAALEMADRHVLYKLAAKDVAAAAGCSLTFMAKLDARLAGSSLHVHTSLLDASGASAFAGDEPLPGTPATSSALFRHWLGGLLAHAHELGWFFAPNVNSYKRYQAGTFAPTGIAWSWDNRTSGFRGVGHGPSLRVECRIPGGDANPYLAYAALLAAGLDGVERELEPGPAFEGDAYAADGLAQVPRSLPEAIAAFEASDFARGAFGDAVVEHLLHFARTEQRSFEGTVTDWERVRFFERG